jgi:hypothetical protein
MLTVLLPHHYFEKPLIVRIIWELWIALRSAENYQYDSNDDKEKLVSETASIDFA